MARTHRPTESLALVLLIGVCFFCTGAAGLIYEIIWNKMLALMMGNTSYSLATLLTVFMGGLALGAWLGGRWAPSGWRAVKVYGILELGVGLYCLLLPHLISAADPLFAAIYRNHYHSQLAFNLMQFVLVSALLILPTTFMGATLPILTAFLVARSGRIARSVGILYAVNSGGAFAGALLAGLLLLPTIGKENSYFIAVSVNVVVGVAAGMVGLIRSRGSAQAGPVEVTTTNRSDAANSVTTVKHPRVEHQSDRRAPAVGEPDLNRWVLLIGFGVSGFCAMVYQIAWTRMVTLSIGSSTYAFTLIAGAFILGLTAGSLMLGWIGDRPFGRILAGLLPMFIGASAILTVTQLGELPIRVSELLARIKDFRELEAAKFRTIFTIFLPATFCMGALLPIVCRYISRGTTDAGRAVGTSYAANAIGTIVGSFCGGFVLIPLIGMRTSILVAAGLSLLVGALFMYQAVGSRQQVGWTVFTAIFLVAASVALALAPTWEQAVITSGPFNNAGYSQGTTISRDEILRRMKSDTVEYFSEGPSALVCVTRTKQPVELLNLIVSGTRDAASSGSMQNWLAHLPMTLAHQTRRVLVIGLGSSHTLGSVELHPGVEEIDCVEISAEVVEAARLYFQKFTNDALSDPRVRLMIADGRLHLTQSDRTYDVIISQPSHPWIAGASAMFTRECYGEMKERLADDGLACIWAQGFFIPEQTFRTLCRTWTDTWEHQSIWGSQSVGSYLFLGSRHPLNIAFGELAGRINVAKVREQLNAMGIVTPAEFMSYLHLSDQAADAFSQGAPLNTDDNSRVEFDTPRGLFVNTALTIFEQLNRNRIDPWQHIHGEEQDPVYRDIRERGRKILAVQNEIARMVQNPTAEDRQRLLSLMKEYPNEVAVKFAAGRFGLRFQR